MTALTHTRTYIPTDRSLSTSDGDRVYTINPKINDLLPNEKPRERLIADGPATLTLSDLLAVVLQVGTVKEDVLTMASRIISEYGEKGVIAEKDPGRLVDELGIPISKACQLVACFELGRRLFKPQSGGPITLRTPKQVYQYTKDLADYPKEHLRGLYLNSRNRLVYEETLSVGTVTANLIHPREVFQPALTHMAVAVILVHNHPSGSSKPSAADIETTKQLLQAANIMGIELLDHIIITKRGFTSILDEYLQ